MIQCQSAVAFPAWSCAPPCNFPFSPRWHRRCCVQSGQVVSSSRLGSCQTVLDPAPRTVLLGQFRSELTILTCVCFCTLRRAQRRDRLSSTAELSHHFIVTEGCRFDSQDWSAACCPCVCLGSLQVLQVPPTLVNKHMTHVDVLLFYLSVLTPPRTGNTSRL